MKDVGVLIFGCVAIMVMAAVLIINAAAPDALGMLFRTHAGLLVGMAAGLFGAAFSMLVQSQRRVSQGTLDDIQAAAEVHTLVVRGAFGVGAATIVYFFFESGLLEGTLWPRLKDIGYDPVSGSATFRVPNRSLCLLVIWCFIAGFSETFVPNLLVRTEARSENRSNPQ